MKKIICIAALVLFALTARAQEAFSQTVEIGIGGAEFNPSFITNPIDLVRSPGVTFYGEYRFGITNWFAVGAQLDLKASNGNYMDLLKFVNGSMYNNLLYYQESLKLLAEFKLFPRKFVKPFFGVAAGVGLGQFKEKLADLNSLIYCDLSPRVGVQLGRHARVSAQFSFSPGINEEGALALIHGDFTSLGLNIGWAF